MPRMPLLGYSGAQEEQIQCCVYQVDLTVLGLDSAWWVLLKLHPSWVNRSIWVDLNGTTISFVRAL